MPAKPKASAKVGAKAKREAIAEAFGSIPVDSEKYMNFLHSRRHLATVRDGKWREPKYIVELCELEQAILKTLDRIHERDGARIFKEAADHLLLGVIMSVESHVGPKGLRRAMDELADQAASISGLSAHVRKVIRRGDRPATAA
jgi:hypothetical protein